LIKECYKYYAGILCSNVLNNYARDNLTTLNKFDIFENQVRINFQ